MKKKNVLQYALVIFTMLTACPAFSQNMLLLKTSGKVVIGDTAQISTPGNYSLYVQNGILTERVKVTLKSDAEWADNAFTKTPTTAMVRQSIDSASHLYQMPSANELVKNGYELKEMDAKILQQVEWLWQHVIALKAENELLQKEIKKLKSK
jgi:trimeric autotransporter adhesin